MTEDEKMEFFEAISIACASYGKALDEFMLASWWECLKDHDLATIKRALLLHQGTEDGAFAPKACHILKQINGIIWHEYNE